MQKLTTADLEMNLDFLSLGRTLGAGLLRSDIVWVLSHQFISGFVRLELECN